MRITSMLALGAAGALSFSACAEAAPVRPSDTGVRPDASSAEDAPGTDAFSAPGADAFVPGADAASSGGGLVINELAPDGAPDFVELLNTGSTPVALGGHIFADADGTGAMADPTHRTLVPAAVIVPPGGYLVVAMNVEPPMGSTETPVGPVTPCPVAGVASCLQTSYGIGRTGDTIVLFAPDGTTEIARVEYAGDLMGATASYCRLPGGTGAFTTCTSTPGAANTM